MDKFLLILIDIAQWERVVKMGTFGVKGASDEYFCPSTVFQKIIHISVGLCGYFTLSAMVYNSTIPLWLFINLYSKSTLFSVGHDG